MVHLGRACPTSAKAACAFMLWPPRCSGESSCATRATIGGSPCPRGKSRAEKGEAPSKQVNGMRASCNSAPTRLILRRLQLLNLLAMCLEVLPCCVFYQGPSKEAFRDPADLPRQCVCIDPGTPMTPTYHHGYYPRQEIMQSSPSL